MSAPFLFIGTSFLGALQLGWRMEEHAPSASFIGVDGPALADALDDGWTVADGKLTFAEKLRLFVNGVEGIEPRATGNQTFPEFATTNGLTLDLGRYATIVFADMFFRPIPMFRVEPEGYISIGNTPVSDTLLGDIRVNGFRGDIGLTNHPRYGTTPIRSALPLIRAIRDNAPEARVLLLSSPRQPRSNLDLVGHFGTVEAARRSFDFVDGHYRTLLAKSDVEYVLQPPDVLDEHGCLTRDKFSRGPHKTRAGHLDPHMNAEYGAQVNASILRHGPG